MTQTPRWLGWEQHNYHRLAQWRDILFRPLVPILTRLKITALMMTLGGVGLMILFAAVVSTRPLLAAVFFITSILFDWIDGPLARYQHTASDKGKLFDVLADTTSFCFFMVGITFANLIDPRYAFGIVLGVIVAKVLGMFRNAPYLETDWLFKPAAGVWPLVVVSFYYFLYLVFIVTTQPYFDAAIVAAAIILGTDSLISIHALVKRGK